VSLKLGPKFDDESRVPTPKQAADDAVTKTNCCAITVVGVVGGGDRLGRRLGSSAGGWVHRGGPTGAKRKGGREMTRCI
jgi:hypothetical protein